jgi:tetratricopeptide (TPR) repeat protein
VLIVQARYQEAIDAFTQLRDEAVLLEDHLAVARAEQGISTAQTNRGELKEALESAERSVLSARLGGGKREEARGTWLQAWSSLRLGAIEEGTRLANEVLAISRELDEGMLLAETLNLQGVIAANTGAYDQARAYFEEAVAIYNDVGNADKQMPLLNNLAVIAESHGNHAKAEDLYRQSLNIAQETGHRDFELLARSNLGGTLVTLDRGSDAEAELRTVLEMASDGHSVLPQTHQFLAKALLLQARTAEAASEALISLDLSLRSEAPDYIASSWRVLGNIASELGAPIEVVAGELSARYRAEELYQKSLEATVDLGDDYERAHTLADWAVHDERAGNREASAEKWAEARRMLTDLGAHSEIERTEHRLAQQNTARS